MGGRGASFSTGNSVSWSNTPGEQEPETLKEALGIKGTPMRLGEALIYTNKKFSEDYAEFSLNCQRCVIAYELRRRGYDVEALPTYKNDKLTKIAYVDTQKGTYEGAWKGAFQHGKTENVGVPGSNSKAEKSVIDNIEKKMKQYGNGSRAVVQVFYRKRGEGGHVFNVENQGGRIVYVEAQTGSIKDIKSTMKQVSTGKVNIMRTDNLKISGRAKKFVRQRKRK